MDIGDFDCDWDGDVDDEHNDDGSCVDEDVDDHAYEITNGASLRLSLLMCYGLLELLAALFFTSCLIDLASCFLDLLSRALYECIVLPWILQGNTWT